MLLVSIHLLHVKFYCHVKLKHGSWGNVCAERCKEKHGAVLGVNVADGGGDGTKLACGVASLLFGVLHLLHPSLTLCVGSTPPSLTPFCLLPCSLVPRQSRVFVSVSISSPDLFHVVLRYANWRGDDVLGRVSVIEDDWNNYCGNCEWLGADGGSLLVELAFLIHVPSEG